MAAKDILSLYQLNQHIKAVLTERFIASVWVRAEVAEFRENRNGHCYLDLVEKSSDSNQIVARSKAIIWSYTYRMLKPYFETTTGRSLSSGLKVLVQVQVEFQEVYGLSLVIRDIDPTYTLGDLEQRKREVIQRLQHEGVFDMNKELDLPLVPQRIAIISSPTAAGYGDFINQLDSNEQGVKFYHHLFSAIMQGDQASESITKAFDRIYENISFFDVVVIIRGGGASLDLICFDDYWLAYHITQFPIPVVTGIGHERDQSVADLVAHSALKTPTAVAGFIIGHAIRFLETINQYSEHIEEWALSELENQKKKLTTILAYFSPRVKLMIQQKKHKLDGITRGLPTGVKYLLQQQKHKLNDLAFNMKQFQQQSVVAGKTDLIEKQKYLAILAHSVMKQQKKQLQYFEKNNRLNNPFEVLKRGYTLTYLDGKLIKDGHALEEGSHIDTRFRDGKVASVVVKKP